MNKGLKRFLSAVFFAVVGAYLTSEASSSPIVADTVGHASVATSSETPSVRVAPTENQLAGRVRRHNRRVYRRMA